LGGVVRPSHADGDRHAQTHRRAAGPTDMAEILKLKRLGTQHGYPDVIDTGSSTTFTRFPYEGGPPPLTLKERKAFEPHLKGIGTGPMEPVKIESGTPGTGEATRTLRSFLVTWRYPRVRCASALR
jgi:hypothetical protein